MCVKEWLSYEVMRLSQLWQGIRREDKVKKEDEVKSVVEIKRRAGSRLLGPHRGLMTL